MHAVVFDIDGTLLQSAAIDDVLYREAVLTVLGGIRLRASFADYDYVSDSGILSQILADNSIAEDPVLLGAVKARFVTALKAHIANSGPFPEIPGAKNALRKFQASADHCVGIATGGWRESAILKLETSGFGAANIPIATSDDAQDRKEIMKIALSHLGCSFSSVTYYGDGPWDREASAELGWEFVAVGPTLNGLRTYNDMFDA